MQALRKRQLFPDGKYEVKGEVRPCRGERVLLRRCVRAGGGQGLTSMMHVG